MECRSSSYFGKRASEEFEHGGAELFVVVIFYVGEGVVVVLT